MPDESKPITVQDASEVMRRKVEVNGRSGIHPAKGRLVRCTINIHGARFLIDDPDEGPLWVGDCYLNEGKSH